MRRLLAAAALAVMVVPAAHASTLELGVSDDFAQLEFATPAGGINVQGAEWGLGLLYNEDDDLIGSARFSSVNRISQAFTFNVGLKGYLGRLDDPDETLTSIAIGGGAAFSLASRPQLTFAVNAWYAPNILTFGDPRGVTELDARVEAGLSRTAVVFAGYRFFEVDFRGRDHEVQDGLQVGVRLGF